MPLSQVINISDIEFIENYDTIQAIITSLQIIFFYFYLNIPIPYPRKIFKIFPYFSKIFPYFFHIDKAIILVSSIGVGCSGPK